jgi:hypothetical protein
LNLNCGLIRLPLTQPYFNVIVFLQQGSAELNLFLVTDKTKAFKGLINGTHAALDREFNPSRVSCRP